MTDAKSPRRPALVSAIAIPAAAALAMLCANTALIETYFGLLGWPLALRLGPLALAKPLVLWLNESLMAIFFLYLGLVLKRELAHGDAASPTRLPLTVLAAFGGAALPAAIYAAINAGGMLAPQGWVIPTATDLVFVLGVLALIGGRAPAGLHLFLASVAIIDDLGAILVIAVFYAADLGPEMLLGSALGIALLTALNRAGVRTPAPYLLVGAALWLCLFKSGVHAALAGLLTALAIPLGDADNSPAGRAERALYPWLAWLVIPLFAFANAGIVFDGDTLSGLRQPVPLGIALGLGVGKGAGVFAGGLIAIRLLGAPLPAGSNWPQFFGACVLAGVGFAPSLFIGSLAFEGALSEFIGEVKLGVVAGSVVSALGGTAILWLADGRRRR